MESIVQLYSDKPGEILNFLNKYFNDSNLKLSDELLWEKHYDNPIEIADIIGTFIENNENYKINMWVSLDKDFY